MNASASPTDQVLLYCFHYDPTNGKYGLVIMNVLRLAALITLGVLGTFMIVMFRRDFRRRATLQKRRPPDGHLLHLSRRAPPPPPEKSTRSTYSCWWSGVGMTVLIFFFVFFFAVKYRRKSPDEPPPKAIHGSHPSRNRLERDSVPGHAGDVRLGNQTLFPKLHAAPHDTLDIYVTGKQWMWKVQYPDGPARNQ